MFNYQDNLLFYDNATQLQSSSLLSVTIIFVFLVVGTFS